MMLDVLYLTIVWFCGLSLILYFIECASRSFYFQSFVLLFKPHMMFKLCFMCELQRDACMYNSFTVQQHIYHFFVSESLPKYILRLLLLSGNILANILRHVCESKREYVSNISSFKLSIFVT